MALSTLAVVRAAIPEATQLDADYILWERTPFPFERVTPRMLYRAASACRRATAKGQHLCDHCPRLATGGNFMCDHCAAAIREWSA